MEKAFKRIFNKGVYLDGPEMSTTAKLSKSILSQLSSVNITFGKRKQRRLKHRQIKMSIEVISLLHGHYYHVPAERTSRLLSPCTYSVDANTRDKDHLVTPMRRRPTASKLVMLPLVPRPNTKSSPLTTITAAAAAAGVPPPPLDLTEENVKQVLVDARAEARSLKMVGCVFLQFGQIFDTSVGITGQVELAELDGPFVKISLKGRFWHERSMVLARMGNYLKQRIPEILEVDIEDEKQLDDSPANF
ncbi:unnamed protein product [Dovyalis caffra]|uniref:Uncharacterized protein n=1 Tax=Dovyalis caffra TaxID=77055 RepID=A0AAV1RHJ5_9ROSI|nr:unnamed protein product [Dovyalis caffra]